jgi:excinuclease ABC subunit C
MSSRGKVIYVGKANVLRSRVLSYFRNEDDGRLYYPFLVQDVADLTWTVTSNEQEALLLENNLIKEHKPRYNVKLVDDKTFLSIKVTLNEKWPRALLVRRVRKDGALYFGPYSSARAIRETLRTIRKFFTLRTCTNREFRQRTRACIQHQIGRCGAPCVGLQSEDEYQTGVDDAVLFLKGRTKDLTDRLKAHMWEASESMRFEQAGRARDQIRAIERATQRQNTVAHDRKDRDVFGDHLDGDVLVLTGLFFREGRMVSSHPFKLRARLGREEALRSFLHQYYAAERPLPDEILFPSAVEDGDLLAANLTERRGKRVQILYPQRGRKRELIALARSNAETTFRNEQERREGRERTLDALHKALGLARRPRRIECIDISNLRGQLAVGSLVAMTDGELDKSRYLRFRVQSPEARGDTEMMTEVIERRLRRGKKRGDLPDLLVLDGGAGQLGVAIAARERAGLQDQLELCALAKSRTDEGRTIRRAGALGPERVFLPGRAEPLVPAEGSPEMHLLQVLRDEAHRFAIDYHRALRRKKTFRSVLDGIPGVGPKRKRALLEHFGSLEALRRASVGDLCLVPTISPTRAEAIHQKLNEE